MADIRRLREDIATLEERAEYIFELSTCLHDHQEMLWRIEERLRAEAAKVKEALAREESLLHPGDVKPRA